MRVRCIAAADKRQTRFSGWARWMVDANAASQQPTNEGAIATSPPLGALVG